MTRLLFWSSLLALFLSCSPSYKRCDVPIKDTSLQLYNDVLTALVEQHFYNFYLGDEAEQMLFKKFVANPDDSLAIGNEARRLQNQLFHDSARFCTLYLDTMLRPTLRPWRRMQQDTSRFGLEFKAFLGRFGGGVRPAAIDSLNQPQRLYKADDFHACTFRIKPFSKAKEDTSKCVIGKVALSKTYYNATSDKALLYYEFTCGELCGRGELIIVERKKGVWLIKEMMLFRVS